VATVSSDHDREAADVWSRGPQRDVTWLPPTAPVPVQGGPRFERADDALKIVLNVFGAIVVFDIAGAVVNALEINSHDPTRAAISGAVQTVMLVIGAFVWIAWFHASYANVEALGAKRRYGPGWAIGGWFIPIMSLWRPKQIANDLWAAGEPDGDPRRPPTLMLWWWLLWILGNGVSGSGIRFGSDPTRAEERTIAILGLGGCLIDAVAAVLACLVATRINERLNARASGHEAGVQPSQQLP
jgi:hypothetical protein